MPEQGPDHAQGGTEIFLPAGDLVGNVTRVLVSQGTQDHHEPVKVQAHSPHCGNKCIVKKGMVTDLDLSEKMIETILLVLGELYLDRITEEFMKFENSSPG